MYRPYKESILEKDRGLMRAPLNHERLASGAQTKWMKCLIGLSSAIALSATWGLSASFAQDATAAYPTRDITIVCPFGPGGPPDAVARMIAAGLSERLGRTVIVENRPGASTALASRTVARAAPDGYTLYSIDISFAVTPHIASNLDTNPFKDFKPIGLAAKSVFTLVASPTLGVSTLEGFIKLTRAKGQEIQIGHTGVGTTPYLAAITFARSTGVKPLLVPYRAVTDATNNVIGGHIAAVFSAAGTAIGVGDKAKILGVTGEKRLAALPNVPTFQESGVKMAGFENGTWYGLVAPAGTPDAIVTKINSALKETANDKNLAAKLITSGIELSASTPQEFGDFIRAQYGYWGETLRAAGVEPEPK